MRRKRQEGVENRRNDDVRLNLSHEQLAGIGAVAVAWNELEIFLHYLLGLSAGIPTPLWLEVSTRVNGLEGYVQIIRKGIALCASLLNLEKEEVIALMEKSLDAVLDYKQYRDGVIHARVFDAPTGLGELVKRRGQKDEVLLTVEALSALYVRLVLLRKELLAMMGLMNRLSRVVMLMESGAKPNKQWLAQGIRAYTPRLRSHQNERLSLPPLPAFPKLPPIPPPVGDEIPSAQN